MVYNLRSFTIAIIHQIVFLLSLIEVGDSYLFDGLLQIMEEYGIRENHNGVMRLVEEIRSLLVCDDVVTMPTPEGTDECPVTNIRSQPTSAMTKIETQSTDDTDSTYVYLSMC